MCHRASWEYVGRSLFQQQTGGPYRRIGRSVTSGAMTPKQLKRAREKLHLGPVEMARAMGVSYETYRQWESGRRSMSAAAVRLAELLLLYPKTAQRLGRGALSV